MEGFAMSEAVHHAHHAPMPDMEQIRRLYQQMLASWNARDPAALAALYAEDGQIIGFDGSQHTGQADIAATMAQIFADHPTATYVGKIRDVRMLSPEVAVLREVAGMVPPGGSDLNPVLNAVQSVVAVKAAGTWRIALFQNTPAQFHGRPEHAQHLTEELRQVLG